MAGTIANKKNNRGRPKMEFISKKPKIKRDKPGRPKKEIKIESKPEVFAIHKNTDNEKRKDALILGMFIFSLVLFTISLYFSQKKQASLENEIQGNQTISTRIDEIENSEIEPVIEPIIQTTGSNTQIEETIGKETPNAMLVGNFYKEFNAGSMLNMYPKIHNTLVSSKIFNMYFSKMRIQRFLRNISSEGVTISNIKEDGPKVNYILSYTLKDGHYFEENREIDVIEKDIPQIGKIMCISTGCSKLPFFNPGRYDIH